MQYKTFKRLRLLTASFVSAITAISVINNNIYLALVGVLIGLLFLLFVRKKTKVVLVDERIQAIGGYAARITYIALTMILALLALFFMSVGKRTNEINYEALGTILSYITLLSLALYSLSYKYYSKKYGEEDNKQD